MKYQEGDIIERYGVECLVLGVDAERYFSYVERLNQLNQTSSFLMFWERTRKPKLNEIMYVLYLVTDYYLERELNFDDVLLTTLSDEPKIGKVNKTEYEVFVSKNKLVLQKAYPAVGIDLYKKDVIDAYNNHPYLKAKEDIKQNISDIKKGKLKYSPLHISTRKGQILLVVDKMYHIVYVKENVLILLYQNEDLSNLLNGILLEQKLGLDTFDDESETYMLGEIK